MLPMGPSPSTCGLVWGEDEQRSCFVRVSTLVSEGWSRTRPLDDASVSPACQPRKAVGQGKANHGRRCASFCARSSCHAAVMHATLRPSPRTTRAYPAATSAAAPCSPAQPPTASFFAARATPPKHTLLRAPRLSSSLCPEPRHGHAHPHDRPDFPRPPLLRACPAP